MSLSQKVFLYIFLTLPVLNAAGEEILVAVASNFTAPMTEIAASFEETTGHEVDMAFGSSGRFLAQISNGAPFQVFLSADQEKPLVLEESGLAIAGSRFTYAIGSLVLWTADEMRPVDGPEVLSNADYNRLALANPRLAPYGRAALQVLENLDMVETTRERWVQGENITQTYQFVSTGNAALGFVALSQVMEAGEIRTGSGWVVPNEFHEPVLQDVVLLKRGESCQACRELLDFMRGTSAREIIQSYGYRVGLQD